MPYMAQANNGSHGGFEYNILSTLMTSLNAKVEVVVPPDAEFMWGYEWPRGSGIMIGKDFKTNIQYVTFTVQL